MRSLQLIVNADDFGISESVNNGILSAHQNGILTSTSIMANGLAFDHAVAMAKTAPSLDVGVHITLVEEQSLLDWQSIPSIADSSGKFHGNAKLFARKYFTGQIALAEVRAEIEAQIAKVINAGINISHIDGHQHLHMLPQVFDVVVELAKKYDIPAMRIPNEQVRSYMLKDVAKVSRVIELLMLKFFCHLRKSSDISSPDSFAGFYYGGRLNSANLMTILQQLPTTGVCEIMCHPGLPDPGNTRDHWSYHWPDELAALVDKRVMDYLQENGIELVSYRTLTAA